MLLALEKFYGACGMKSKQNLGRSLYFLPLA